MIDKIMVVKSRCPMGRVGSTSWMVAVAISLLNTMVVSGMAAIHVT